MNKTEEKLFDLVDELCTADQVKELLRLGKESRPKDIRVTAENKRELIQRNLRVAVESGGISIDKVYDAIRSSEECGNQHIFYFRPRQGTARESLELDPVRERLWGRSWRETKRFPRADTPKDGFDYADFRSPDQKPNHWILKVYGQLAYQRYTGHDEERNDRVYKEFVRETLRVVLVARWNPPSLLELRVQRDESRKRINSWLLVLWRMLEPAIKREDFDPWDLTKARKRLIEEEAKYEGIYTFRDTRLIDPHKTHASFEPYETDGYLFASIEAKEAIQGLLDAKSKCTNLSVTWLLQNDGTPSIDLRTLLGDRETNEVVVYSHCKAKDLDYVTDKLRFFNR